MHSFSVFQVIVYTSHIVLDQHLTQTFFVFFLLALYGSVVPLLFSEGKIMYTDPVHGLSNGVAFRQQQ